MKPLKNKRVLELQIQIKYMEQNVDRVALELQYTKQVKYNTSQHKKNLKNNTIN